MWVIKPTIYRIYKNAIIKKFYTININYKK